MHNQTNPNRHQSFRLFALITAIVSPAIIFLIVQENPQHASKKMPPLVGAHVTDKPQISTKSAEEESDFEEQREEAPGVCKAFLPPIAVDQTLRESQSARTPTLQQAEGNRFSVKRAPVKDFRITSTFGMRIHPVTHQRAFHNGVDYSAKLNQRVFSVLDGTVVQCGPRGGLGIAVEIYHPMKRTSTIYGHLNEELVYGGQQVRAGQTIGLAGTTGRSTGVHVHFTVKQNCRYVEPLAFLSTLPKSMQLYLPQQPISVARANAARGAATMIAATNTLSIPFLERLAQRAVKTVKTPKVESNRLPVPARLAQSASKIVGAIAKLEQKDSFPARLVSEAARTKNAVPGASASVLPVRSTGESANLIVANEKSNLVIASAVTAMFQNESPKACIGIGAGPVSLARTSPDLRGELVVSKVVVNKSGSPGLRVGAGRHERPVLVATTGGTYRSFNTARSRALMKVRSVQGVSRPNTVTLVSKSLVRHSARLQVVELLAKHFEQLTLVTRANTVANLANEQRLFAERRPSLALKPVVARTRARQERKISAVASVSRFADGARLAAEIGAELTKTRAALSEAQRRSDLALALYNQGAISARDAQQSQATASALQEHVGKLESNSKSN